MKYIYNMPKPIIIPALRVSPRTDSLRGMRVIVVEGVEDRVKIPNVNKWVSVKIPKGFVCDGASIPRSARPFLGALQALSPGVIHDWLYREGVVDREYCDKIFLHQLELSGVSKWVRKAAYWAVRGFGESHYNGKTE